MITIHELREDDRFEKYFTTVPEIPEHYYAEGHRPWRLLVLVKGEQKWRSQRVEYYDEALERLDKIMPKIANAAINNPGLNFMPPIRHFKVKNSLDKRGKPVIASRVWTPNLTADMDQHHWCGYCRRPTVFGYKALRPRMLNGYRLGASEIAHRCLLCGSSADLMDIRKPQMNQRWDVNRPRFFGG